MEFISMPRRETCRYYQWESHASAGFIIAAVLGQVLLRSGLTLHILLLVLFFYLMQGVGGQDDELTEEEMRHRKQQDQCNAARKRFNSARMQ